MSQSTGGSNPFASSHVPARVIGGPIVVWKTEVDKLLGKSEQIRGDRFDSLPPTSKLKRRLRGERATSDEAALKRTRGGGSFVLDNSTKDRKRQAWLEILGAGSFGIAGLWTFEDTAVNKGPAIKNVVVKQSGASPMDVKAMRGEAEIMKLFANRDTRHIVKIYREFVAEMVNGQVDPIGNGRGTYIARIFIEYCEGGDFRSFLRMLRGKFTAQIPIPEELIWHIFKCFVLGLVIMENGNELLQGPKWSTEVVHFDIKPENVLVASNDNEHTKTPVIKIADFGVSRVIPIPQSIEWMAQQLGTPHYKAPEYYQSEKKYPAIYNASPNEEDDYNPTSETFDPTLKFGAHTNVWAVGKVMWNLINRSHSFAKDAPEYHFQTAGTPTKAIGTQGEAILKAPYSATLRRTVMHCLAVEWQQRPKPRELLAIINGMLAAIDKAPVGVRAGLGVGLGAGFDAGLTLRLENVHRLEQISAVR
ncbi:kinase-like protein [Acephala macrosclerotiorum]|nr:kinase-like protein [Acephala macrosclerotiorum]